MIPKLWMSESLLWRGRGALYIWIEAGWRLKVDLITREYVDMSNDKTEVKSPVRRKPKVSWATLVVPGLAGT